MLEHKGNLNPERVVRKQQSASLTWIKYKGEPLLQPIKDVVTVESSRAYQVRRIEFLGRAFFREVLARNFNLNYLLKLPTVLDLE